MNPEAPPGRLTRWRRFRAAVALAVVPGVAWTAEPCPTATPGFAAPPAATCVTGALRLVPNYETVSVELDGRGAGPAQIRFRVPGSAAWLAGLELSHDDRFWSEAGDPASGAPRQWRPALAPGWRGAIVHLTPDTGYEVQVLLPDGALHCGVTATRPRTPQIAHVIDLGRVEGPAAQATHPHDPTALPADQPPAVTLSVAGGRLRARRADGSEIGSTPAPTPDGHVLIVGRDVSGGGVNIRVDAPYIVLRGLRLHGAQRHGVELGPRASDVLIENLDISGWGRRKARLPPGVKDPHHPGRLDHDPATWGPDLQLGRDYAQNWDSGVFAEATASRSLRRITVRGSRIHTPRYDACSWDEFCPEVRPGRVNGIPRTWVTHPLGHCDRGPHHPKGVRCHAEGAQGISLRGSPLGQVVIEDNVIDGPHGHFFNDGMGGQTTDDWGGFPGPHSDIARNVVSGFMDDGLELDNGGRNVRAWDNVVRAIAPERPVYSGASGISAAPVAIGPFYAWRNLLIRASNPPGRRANGMAFKLQPGADGPPPRRDGAIHLINNSAVAVDPAVAGWEWHVSSSTPNSKVGLRNIRVWNNVFSRPDARARLCRFCGGALQGVEFRRNWRHGRSGDAGFDLTDEAEGRPPIGADDQILAPLDAAQPVSAADGWSAGAPIRGLGLRVPNFADCHPPDHPGPDLGALPGLRRTPPP